MTHPVGVGMDGEVGRAKFHAPSLKRRVMATLDDLVSNFLYYDRKEDDELPRNAIEDAILADVITVSEIASAFESLLLASVVRRNLTRGVNA